MKLNFLGRGAGFSSFKEGHTSAYFENGNTLVVIDCSITTYYKLQKMELSKYENIHIYITHTHGDHISGLGLFIQYCYFVLQKRAVVYLPNDLVCMDFIDLMRIEGTDDSWYEYHLCEFLIKNKAYFKQVVKTVHSPQLKDKCFGYVFEVNGTNVVYTGDTSTLEPFDKYIIKGTELYVDTSVHYGQIHYATLGVKVYLMHLDDVKMAKDMIKDLENIEVVKII